MKEISEFLAKAKAEGLIDTKTFESLEGYRTGGFLRQFSGKSEDGFLGLDVPNDPDDFTGTELSEAPRFVRGFHDVLITIGILVFLTGLSFFQAPLLVIAAVIVLSEIFVARKNLALPAFTLTLAFCVSVGFGIIPLVEDAEQWSGIVFFTIMAVALAVYYWRYKVPVALAILIWSAFGLLFFVFLTALSGAQMEEFVEANLGLVAFVGLVLSIAMFALAMWFDLRDRLRRTRRSDVAFWLHLGTAPLLLYSAFLLLFGEQGFWWSGNPSVSEALVALVLVTVLMLIGIIIDRRAFVTSGLISLGAAISVVIQNSGLDFTSVGALALVAVGVVVLALGSGWTTLRKVIVGLMPDQIRKTLPPILS